jgi:hypothetical protein
MKINNFIKIFGLFTIWCFILHLLSYYNYIPSTKILAIFVLFISIILYWIYPGYYFKWYKKKLCYIFIILIAFDILFHYLPVYILHKKEKKQDTLKIAWKEILITIIIYILVMRETIFTIYKDPFDYITN